MKKLGLTLIEVIIASLILSITVGGILYLFSTEKVVISRTGRRVEAMNFARQTIEQLRNEVRDDTWLVGTLSAGTHSTEAFLSLSGTELGDKFPGQGRSYTVTDIDADSGFDSDGNGVKTDDIDYKKVTVTVDWTEPAE